MKTETKKEKTQEEIIANMKRYFEVRGLKWPSDEKKEAN